MPTAQASADETEVTALRKPGKDPLFGLGTMDQVDPLKCSTRVCSNGELLYGPEDPIAQTSVALEPPTPFKIDEPVPAFGVETKLEVHMANEAAGKAKNAHTIDEINLKKYFIFFSIRKPVNLPVSREFDSRDTFPVFAAILGGLVS